MAGRGVGWRRIQRVGHQPQADAHACHMEQVPRRHGEAFRGARCRRFDVPPRLVAHLRCHGAHACRPPVDRHVGAVQRRVGQFDACDAAERIHALDPTRPIDATSGWYDQRCGDFHSVHNYFRPLEIYPDKGPLRGYVAEYEKRHKRRRRAAHYAVLPVAQHGVRAFVISEFGGLAQLVADHAAVSRAYGYGEYDSIEDWRTAVRSVLDSAESLESRGLAGYVYTQVSDVEEELNGLMTYDRRLNKFAQ